MRSPPHGWRRRGALIGAALAALMISPAAADPLTDWIPEEAQVVLTFRGADAPARLVKGLKARFGHVQRVATAADRLLAWQPAPNLQPLMGKWGPGLAPSKGVGLFLSGPRHVRFVIGADDSDAARQTLVDHFSKMDVRSELTPDGLRLDGQRFQCATGQGFLACDTHVKPAAKATPSWLAEPPVPTDGLALFYLRDRALRELVGAPMKGLWVSVTHEADRLAFSWYLAPDPAVAQGLQFVGDAKGRSPLSALVDQRTPAMLRIGVEGPALLSRLEQMTGPPPPQVADLWQALKSYWTGEIVLAADAALLHPVMLVGLSDPKGGEALLSAIAKMANAEAPEINLSLVDGLRGQAGLRGLQLVSQDESRTTFTFPWAVVKTEGSHALVLAASPADVIRRVEGKVRPLDIDGAFSGRGDTGLVLPNLPGGWGMYFLYELLSSAQYIELFDAQVILSLAIDLLDEVGVKITPSTEGVRAEMWWRFL